jgi:hypothetical protein
LNSDVAWFGFLVLNGWEFNSRFEGDGDVGVGFLAGGYESLTNGIDVDGVVGSFDEGNDFFDVGVAANV